ncbi:MAG: hypothetical protein ACK5Q2_03290, partial [Bacteroidota bacterium]
MIRTTTNLSLRSLSVVIMALLLPLMAFSQRLRLVGNVEFFVASNQGVYAPDGLVVQDNATNILPSTLILGNGTVLLEAVTALYKVHSVPASGSAVFYSAFPQAPGRPAPPSQANGNATGRDAAQVARMTASSGVEAGLTIINGTSGVSDFTLKLDAATDLGTSSLPVVWEVSQTTGTGIGNLTFKWDASLEPITLANKRLYEYASGAWTVLP